MKKLKVLGLAIGTAIVGISIASSAALAESFVLDGNKALNTNNNFSRFDGEPRMSIFDFNPSDPDQQFDRIQGSRGGTLLKHRSTGKCLNSHYLSNGGLVNVWSCNPADPDQNFNITALGGGYSQIQRTGTNLCVDSPTRNNTGTVYVWQCAGNANQRWKNGATPVSGGQITLPFRSGQTWYVCQGYNGSISHRNTFGLDLSIGRDIGSTACYAADGNVSRSAGQPVLAPAGGRISYINSDLVCLSIDNNRSLLLGHMNNRVASGTVVRQGDVLGYVSAANNANGGFSHIHLEGRNSSNCAIGTSVPLTSANNLQLFGIGDLVGNQSHFGQALSRP